MNKDFLDFHEETLRRLPKKAKPWAVRGDGVLNSEKLIEEFQEQNLVYAISAQMNAALRSEISKIDESAWEEAQNDSGRPYSIARIHYRPKTWSKTRTFIISRRLRPNVNRWTLGTTRIRVVIVVELAADHGEGARAGIHGEDGP